MMLTRKHLYTILCTSAFAFGLFSIYSCEKVIDLPLENAARKYVIEGYIDDLDSCKVLISKTRSFYDSNDADFVTGASVSIADNNGTPVTLQETGRGVYQTSAINGAPGHSYSLKVTINGEVFTALSTMPQPVPLDSIYITNRLSFDGSRRKVVTALFDDPPGKGQAYRFVKFVNGGRDFRIFVQNDALSDGRTIRAEIRGGLATNDTVDLEMQCIEMPVYQYWFTLDQNARGENDAPAPGNPVTNIRGGALGVFSAHTSKTKRLIVQ
jgi:hypothetical protein